MIKTKEEMIKSKEEEKGEIKATIEIENADRENEIQALRNQLAEQNALLDSQRKQLNELQVRCEFTENDMIRGNRELLKKKQQKKQLTLQYQECDQATVTLKNQHGMLEADYKNKMTILKGALAPTPGQKNDQLPEQPPGTNMWGKPIAPTLKTRSNNAVFSGETVFQKQARLGVEEELRNKKQ
jgi:YesN/AraC family two-component response regulator